MDLSPEFELKVATANQNQTKETMTLLDAISVPESCIFRHNKCVITTLAQQKGPIGPNM